MTASPFIPTLRGYLAFIALVANALIVPLLIPAYDGPGFGVAQRCVAIVLAVSTTVVCFRCLQKSRPADRVAGALCALFACWMFYVLVRRIF
jgi:hypothetical protein